MPDRILISNDNINKASWKRLKPEMLCYNGKVSVAGFLYAILSTASISLVLITFLPSDIRTSYRLAFCVGVPIVIHGISNVIAYFVANDEDFSVSGTIKSNYPLFKTNSSYPIRLVSLYSL